MLTELLGAVKCFRSPVCAIYVSGIDTRVAGDIISLAKIAYRLLAQMVEHYATTVCVRSFHLGMVSTRLL